MNQPTDPPTEPTPVVPTGKRWHQRWSVRGTAAAVLVLVVAAACTAGQQSTETVAPAPADPAKAGSAAWLISEMRGAGLDPVAVPDEMILSIADRSCAYREAHGPSGAELARIAEESGFTKAQAEAISTRTYVYCEAKR